MKLLYMVSHPIQYQAPLLRRIAEEEGLSLRVLFESDFSQRAYRDPGFQTEVEWDVPLRQGYDSALVSEVDMETELEACDVLWTHGWGSPALRNALARAKALGKPTLMRGENWDKAMPDGWGPKGWLKRRYLARIFETCTAFLTIGGLNREYYLQRGVAAERIFSMPYAVDNAFFASRAAKAAPHREALRQELGLESGRKVILYAGKFIPRKHPDWLVEAWNTAPWPEGQKPHLLMVGDGEMRAALEARKLGGIKFTGFRNQTELPRLYDLADVFVLPSEQEPWGLAVNEAMACGTAVVVSDQVGAAYDLVHPGCGAVFETGDLGGLAEALMEVTAHSEARGAAAREAVADWDFEADVKGLREALEWVGK